MTQQANDAERLLGEHELYAVYLEVARRDHAWRRRALYGEHTPPESHSPFRPLSETLFQQRRHAACLAPQGALRFQQQLLRRAHYYQVDLTCVGQPTSATVGAGAIIPSLSGLPLTSTTEFSPSNPTT